MKIYNKIEDCIVPMPETAIALGYFDGVHIAHQKIINQAVAFRKRCNFLPTVMTFSVKASSQSLKAGKHIITDATKLEIFERHGVEQVFMPSFEDIKDLSPKEFFNEILIKKLNARAITCGYNFTFGKNASGSVDDLMDFCEENYIELVVVNPQKADDILVSSTKIREAIATGDIILANHMLDYQYFIKAEVCHGNHLGRILGFPTINMKFDDEQIVPLYGVYQTIVYIGQKIYRGLTNVGVKPTIDIGCMQEPVAETYILGFDEDLYGEVVVVAFERMLRREQKFDNLEVLKAAIRKDVDSIN